MPRLMRHMGHEVIIHGKDGKDLEDLWMEWIHQEEFLFEMDSVEEDFFLSYLLLRFSLLGEDDVYFKNLLKRYSENVQPFCPNTF